MGIAWHLSVAATPLNAAGLCSESGENGRGLRVNLAAPIGAPTEARSIEKPGAGPNAVVAIPVTLPPQILRPQITTGNTGNSRLTARIPGVA